MSRQTKDLSRIVKGIHLIVDQLLHQNQKKAPEMVASIKKFQQHATELAHSILSLKEDVDWSLTKNKVTRTESNEKSDNGNMNVPQEAVIETSIPPMNDANEPKDKFDFIDSTGVKESTIEDPIGFPSDSSETVNDDIFKSRKHMRERSVPSTQLARMWGFGSLAVRMALGSAVDNTVNLLSGENSRSISDQNAERLAEALCRMRGAALKLGQMLSMQDDTTLPPALSKALERVRQSADYMPERQLDNQLCNQLGSEWRTNFAEFDLVPIAAASIGQVHRGKLHNGTNVAIKIQYPGVAESIDSDLQNLKRLITLVNFLPPGLYIDQIIKVASQELTLECDYSLEGINQMKYRDLVLADPVLRKHVYVPKIFPEVSTNRILVSELVPGISIERAADLSQRVRNAIARTTLVATIRELFEWRFMQSDPNFSNFLYHDQSRTINMIDFGAARQYRKEFVDGYMRLVWAAANRDKQTIIEVSKLLGFLTGDESQEMLHAHAETGLIVGEPFLSMEPYDFSDSRLTSRISQYGNVFMKYRLTPPPAEAYSLHRKLAGAFLLCIRLKANIVCRDILEDTFKKYNFDDK